MATSESLQRLFSYITLGSALIASSILFYRIVKGFVPIEESGMSAFLPLVGATAVAMPSLQRVSVEKRLERLEMEGAQ